VEVGAPGPGAVRLRQTAIGVDYHDVYIRTGLYKGWMELPGIPGVEAAGVVDAVEPDITGFAPGDHLGAQVIGTVGNAEKAILARQSGCEHTVLYHEEDLVARVAEITAGLGVDVVYDSVGQDTLAGSLECLGLLGHLVNFGQSSGPVEPFAVSCLGAKSNSITRPVVFHHVAQRAALETAAGALFKALARGILEIDIAGSFPLAKVAEVHRMLEARRSTDSLILLP